MRLYTVETVLEVWTWIDRGRWEWMDRALTLLCLRGRGGESGELITRVSCIVVSDCRVVDDEASMGAAFGL
jgi:hypothetical protein